MDIRIRFAVTQNLIYLNHAAMAPWPLDTEVALRNFVAENVHQGSLDYPKWSALEQSLRLNLQQLINAPAIEDIGLIHNTSVGLSFIAEGIDWQAGDNIVTVAQEFPSNRYPWLAQAYRGVSVRELDLTTTDEPEKALLALCDARTRLITVSAVQFGTGLRMDLARIGAFCRAHAILFCVDAIQQIGAIPLDVQAIHADFVVADAHKWLLGPEGIALFYCHATQRERLRLTQFGWHMMETVGNYTNPEFVPTPSARRFEAGSPNMLGIHALHASLGVLMEVGIEQVWTDIQVRMQRLYEGFQTLTHVELLSDLHPKRQSGIVTIRPTQNSSEALFDYLKQHKVFCAPRGGGVRFSPHFYTPFVHIDRTLELIETFGH